MVALDPDYFWDLWLLAQYQANPVDYQAHPSFELEETERAPGARFYRAVWWADRARRR
ncbi:hypothetical protein STRDD11_00973 [Streptococcus sp. DD11]|nr:hypothetical protein STRDD11_00973 [Streptococcus sp. DD11]